ncbi:MAG: hypothetical protein ACI81R_000959 [Bradymonadia bacterium]|jgi:hypothetical protein
MIRVVLSLLVPLLLAVALVTSVARDVRQPDDLGLSAQLVDDMATAGDLVVLVPESRTIDLHVFNGHDAIAVSRLPAEFQRVSRVFLVRDAWAQNPSTRRQLAARGTLLLSRTYGDITVDLFQLRAMPPALRSLDQQLASATVQIVPNDDAEAPYDCTLEGDRFQCGEAEWTYVGPVTQTMAGEPHQCIWSHPIEDADLVITFPAVPGAERLVGWYGLSDYAAHLHDGGRVTLEVETGAAPQRFMARRIPGRQSIDTRVADPSAPIVLRVSAIQPGVRHLCWSLTALGNEPDAEADAAERQDAEGPR